MTVALKKKNKRKFAVLNETQKWQVNQTSASVEFFSEKHHFSDDDDYAIRVNILSLVRKACLPVASIFGLKRENKDHRDTQV